jgi:hypothetical protein
VDAVTPENNFTDLEHFTWCALIACQLDKRERKVISDMASHRFIMSWLRTAKKQKRFPRTVASDIDYLISYGIRHGLSSRLREKIEFMHLSCGDISRQSDLFRLTYASKSLRDRGWRILTQDDQEWDQPQTGKVFCFPDRVLKTGFDEIGWQLTPIPLRLWGDNPEEALLLLAQYQLKVKPRACRPDMMELEVIGGCP